MTAAAIALVTGHQEWIGHAVARLTGRALPVRLGLAYPLARRFRTAMTLGMFSIVMLTLVYMSVLSYMFRGQTDSSPADLGGGFDIVATSNSSNPVTAGELAGLPGVDAVAPLSYVFADFARGHGDQPMAWPVTGIGPELLAAPPKLDNIGSYATNDAAWAAVVRRPTSDHRRRQLPRHRRRAAQPTREDRRHVAMRDPQTGVTRELTVAAKAADDLVGNGPFVSATTLREMFGARANPSRYFVSSTSPDATAAAIRSTFIVNGADATTIASIVGSILSQSSSFFTLMQQFVGAGLVVGVAGIGVIMIRAVRERRREVGVLRSLGFPSRSVAEVMVFEAGFVALEGILIGVAIALVASYGFGATGARLGRRNDVGRAHHRSPRSSWPSPSSPRWSPRCGPPGAPPTSGRQQRCASPTEAYCRIGTA